MAARLFCPPPFVNLASDRIAPAGALSQIQSFLEEANHKEYLQPDCLFDDEGPHVNKAGGIALHQLRRVEKGLRGITLKPEEEANLELGMAKPAATSLPYGNGDDQPVNLSQEMQAGDDRRLDALIASRRAKAHNAAAGTLAYGETDDADMDMINGEVLESYQEQLHDQGDGVVRGEVGDRNPASPTTNEMSHGRPDRVLPTDSTSKKRRYEEAVAESRGSKEDKESRKRAKKEKQKERARIRSMPKSQVEDDGGMSDEPTVLPGQSEPSIFGPIGNGNATSPQTPKKEVRFSQQTTQSTLTSPPPFAFPPSPQSTKKTGSTATPDGGKKPKEKHKKSKKEASSPDAKEDIEKDRDQNGTPAVKPSTDSMAEGAAVKKRKDKSKHKHSEHEQSALDLPLDTPAKMNGRPTSKSILEYNKDSQRADRFERKQGEKKERSEKKEKKKKKEVAVEEVGS